MLNPDLLPDHVHTDISKNLGFDPGDDASSRAIERLSVEEAFERYLRWNGIIGYGRQIISALDGIRAAENTSER